MRYLAIDPGSKRTGLAVGDDDTGIASPLAAIHTGAEQERLIQIGHAIEEHGPGALVVGLPLNMDGTEGPPAAAARGLAGELGRRFKLQVHLQDERLSSVAADEFMSQSGLTHKQKKARRDSLAAMAILKSFLDTR